jgi:beta-glucosidase
MKLIAQPLDWLGINYYNRLLFDPHGQRLQRMPGSEYTEMGWEVHGPGLHRLLTTLRQRYPVPPIYIIENGAAFQDHLTPDGRVPDPRRIHYLRDYLTALQAAVHDGVDVRGYFVWSLLDNFEWAFGYSKRFGIIYVDYATQRRVIKDSGYWYTQVIARNGIAD